MSELCHGDTIVLRANYMDGNCGIVKKSDWIASISWKPLEDISHGVEFTVGDIGRRGEHVKVDEPVLLEYKGKKLVGKDLLGFSLLTSRDGDGKVVFGSTLKGSVRTDRVYTLSIYGKRIGRHNHDFFSALDTSVNARPVLFSMVKLPDTVSLSPTLDKAKVRGLLLIDDGPSAWSLEWLKWCEEKGCHFAMMLNGLQASKHPEWVDAFTRSAVCTWGVHTKTHRNAANDLSIQETREEIQFTLDQIKASYKRCGMEYVPVRLYRFPFTDAGSGFKHQELQSLLAEFGFDVTPEIRKAQWGSKRRDCIGIFFQDGSYQGDMWHAVPEKTTKEYIEHMEAVYTEVKKNYGSKWDFHGVELLGCHCGSLTVETFKFWMSKGFDFSKPVV